MRYYPERKPRQRSWPARNRSEQARFRRAVLARAGDRCEYRENVLDPESRCTVTGAPDLVAHHCEPGNADPATGMALCRPHHRALDSYAR